VGDAGYGFGLNTMDKENDMNDKKWQAFVKKVTDREENDDHLSTEERKDFLRLWKARNPRAVLTGDVDEDFVNVIFS
jgi:hypothetical protein